MAKKEMLNEDTILFGTTAPETSYVSSISGLYDVLDDIPADEVALTVSEEMPVSVEEPVEASQESNAIDDVMQHLMAIQIRAKLDHWNATDWGSHLGFDKVYDDISDEVDKLGELYYMKNSIKLDTSKLSRYQELIGMEIMSLVQETIDCVRNAIASATEEGMSSYLGSLSEMLETKIGFVRLSQNSNEEQPQIPAEVGVEPVETDEDTLTSALEALEGCL